MIKSFRLFFLAYILYNPVFLQENSDSATDSMKTILELVEEVKNKYPKTKNFTNVDIIDFYYDQVRNDYNNYNDIGYWYMQLKEYDKAISVYKILEDKEHQSLNINPIYYNLSCIYSIRNDIELSSYYFEKALMMGWGMYLSERNWTYQDPDLIKLRLSKKFDDLIKFYWSSQDIGAASLFVKLTEKREESDNNRSKRQTKKLAKEYVKLAEKELKSNFIYNHIVRLSYGWAAILYYDIKDYKRSIRYRKLRNDYTPNLQSIDFRLISISYENLGLIDSALAYADSAIVIARKNNNYKQQSKAYRNAAYIYDNIGNAENAAKYMQKSFTIDPSSFDIENDFFWIDEIMVLMVQKDDLDGLFELAELLNAIDTELNNPLFSLRTNYFEAMLMAPKNMDYSVSKLDDIIKEMENFPNLDKQIILDAYEGYLRILGTNMKYLDKALDVIKRGVSLTVNDEKENYYYYHEYRYRLYVYLEDWNKVKYHSKKIIEDYENDKTDWHIDIMAYYEAMLMLGISHNKLEEMDDAYEIFMKVYEENEFSTSNINIAEGALIQLVALATKEKNDKLLELSIDQLSLFADKMYTNPTVLSREINDRILLYFELSAALALLNSDAEKAIEKIESGKYRFLKTKLNKDAGYVSYPELEPATTIIGIEQINALDSPLYMREDMSIYDKLNFNNLITYKVDDDSIIINTVKIKEDDRYLPLHDLDSYLDSVNNSIKNLSYDIDNKNNHKSLVIESILDDDIIRNKKIRFVVDPKLQLTPFEALIDTSGNFLIETKEISYTYSLTVHSILQTRKYSAQKDNALVFANPKHNKPKQSSNLEGLLEDVLLNKGINKYNISDIHRGFGYGNWENLPAAEKEAININELIEADIFINDLATEDKLIELNQAGKLKDYNIIHFATHALSIPELPDASAIILTNKISDGYLTPKEISKLELNADFVNLSACQTAVGKQYSSEGIIGFAQSFIQAGANGVITSLWNVSDESTAIFMTSFYSHYSKNKNVSKSLATTKREFINGDYGAEYKKPFYWAPYIYYGI